MDVERLFNIPIGILCICLIFMALWAFWRKLFPKKPIRNRVVWFDEQG